ncbi:ABC transporter substrate-binding protein [Ornithinibacillus bavariensis]|uniref:ABC transporter substrate-binding protein n=1 Tax=Ornithinibacillus bavariensis TaxID=545502 RepID=A0A920C5Z0_9BACI|nr:ABC transporter substrate-binding protein [Ornithinibacillus bavariensis]GIO25569.1 hypothetical protein J43TS3_01800 [Ornithinibacillus bavariensis]
MKYRNHLKSLLHYFPSNIQTETTISSLAVILNCSERHVKTILKSLHEQGDIQWVIQRGRGKKPLLTIILTEEQLLFEEAKELVSSGKYRKAFEIAKSLKSLQNEFNQWMEADLGIVHEKDENVEQDILRYSFYETKLCMDPIKAVSRHDGHMIQQIFDRLVEYDPERNVLLPRLARSWESGDGRIWIFYLQKGVPFHHGREMTSEDVKQSIKRIPSNNIIVKSIKEIATPSPYTIVFYLNEVDYLFPRYFSNSKASIVPIEVILGDEKKFQKFPIGTGPYRLTVHDDDLVRLDVFKNYYRERPWLDKIEIIKTANSAREVNHPLMLKAPDDSWEEIREIEEGADYITFNCSRSLIRDIRFRKRLSEIINPVEFCIEGEIVASSFLSNRSLELNEKKFIAATKMIPIDTTLKIAAQEIREGVNHEREAIILQNQLKRAGIDSTIEIVKSSELSKPKIISSFDLVVGGIALSDDHLLSVLTATVSNHLPICPSMSKEIHKKVDNFMTRIKLLQDESSRWKLYFEMEDYLKSEYQIIFLNHRTHTIYQHKDSEYANIELDHHGRVDYRRVWKRHKAKFNS